MFEVFLNEVPQGHGVLQVQLEQLGNATASGHVGAHNGNSLALRGEVDLSTLLHLFDGDAPRVMVSPDDDPPRSPKLLQLSETMANPNGDPPRPPRIAMEIQAINGEQPFQALLPMADPHGDPPRPPR